MPQNTGSTLDMERLRKACKNLKKHWKTRIRDLDHDSKGEFEIIASHVGSLHNTEAYPLVYNLIQNEYKELIRPDNIEPGTLSGYIGGCAIETNIGHFSSMPGCGVYCAGNSIPSPALSIVGCSYAVLLANFLENRYTFQLLYTPTDGDRKYAIIYVQKEENLFRGFSEEEKRALRLYNIEQVNIIQFHQNHYEELNGGFLSVDLLPTRICLSDATNVNENGGMKKWEFGIFIILLLIFIGLAGFLFWQYKHHPWSFF